MALSLDVVTRISNAVAAEHRTRVDAITIASADAEAGRVEVLVALAGCTDEPCRILLNINRDEPEQLEEELRTKLAQALGIAGAAP